MNRKKRIFIYVIALVIILSGVIAKNITSVNKGEALATCTLIVECTSILENPEAFNPEKMEIVPDDGIILMREDVEFKIGENAFEILKRELMEEKIHFEFSKTQGYDTMYIEGIANIYQMDAGEMSGWLYYVNDESPSVSADNYIVEENDVIKWKYSVNMLEDF